MTPRQMQLVEFVRAFTEERGFCPSFDEIKEAMGLKSKSGVHRIVEACVQRGYLARHRARARALEVLDGSNVAASAAHVAGFNAGYTAGYKAGWGDAVNTFRDAAA